LPNQQLLEALLFRAYYTVSAKRSSNPVLDTYMLEGAEEQSVLLDTTGEALRVDSPIVSLPTNNINQQTSLFPFIRYTLHRSWRWRNFCLIFIV